MSRLYVVMGVAGSGKSSIGAGVAAAIGGTYIDGDDYHPQSNIDKMSSGKPLTDEDRWPWLARVAAELAKLDGIGLIGCSALKRAYRDFIARQINEDVTFLFLSGSKDLIAGRMAAREGHFMPTALLDSQFDALEVPQEDERKIIVDIDAPPDEIIAHLVQKMRGKTDGK